MSGLVQLVMAGTSITILTVTVGYSFVQRQLHGDAKRLNRIEDIGVAVSTGLMVGAAVLAVVL